MECFSFRGSAGKGMGEGGNSSRYMGKGMAGKNQEKKSDGRNGVGEPLMENQGRQGRDERQVAAENT